MRESRTIESSSPTSAVDDGECHSMDDSMSITKFEEGSICLEAELLLRKELVTDDVLIARVGLKKELMMLGAIRRAYMRRKLKKERAKLLLELAIVNRHLRSLDEGNLMDQPQNQNQQNQNIP
jgi:hypothetical protein